MKKVLSGWSEIAQYIRTSVATAQRYERNLRLPVRRHGTGPKAHVYAIASDLDHWLSRMGKEEAIGDDVEDETWQNQLIQRIQTLPDIPLHRRNYHMFFDLRPFEKGVRVNIDIEFTLVNRSDEDQPFVQEITVDDSERGHVRRMIALKNGATIYSLNNPPVAGREHGYSIYRGNKLMIEPRSHGFLYECRASWVIHRADEDMWYNHMLMLTHGVRIETHAPPNYAITPSFETSRLFLKGDHLDIAWCRRK